MALLNPKTVKPRRDWVLVLNEPRKEVLSSGIVLAVETGVEKVTEGAGRVIRSGGGKCDSLLRDGDRIAYRSFLKHATPIETDEKWEDGRKKEYFLMSVDDIMAVIPDAIDIGVFSRPATSGK